MTSPVVVKFDGIDGSGKTSLLAAVKDLLTSEGRTVTSVVEFGSEFDVANEEHTDAVPIGPRLREIALSPIIALDDIERELMFAIISRRTNRRAIPRAASGAEIVLVDRSNFGNLAYGSAIDERLNYVFQSFVEPLECADLIFVVDTPVAECQHRMRLRGRTDVVEVKGVQFFEVVASNYRELARSSPSARVLDGTRGLDELSATVKEAIDLLLSGRAPPHASDA